MSDLISRQQAIGVLIGCTEHKGRIQFDKAVAGINKLPPAEPKTGRWIPCKERLPEEYCECLVTYRTVDMQEFMEILEYEPSYGFDYEKGRFKGEWLFPTDDERFTDSEVIAWQPLPEPYKEDAQ